MDWRGALRARAVGLAGGRVYWAERPQGGELPALVLSAISDGRDQHLKGFQGLQPARVQIDAYAANPADAWALAEAAIALLVPAAVSNGHQFTRAVVDIPPRDLVERVANTTVFRVSMDLIFHHAASEEGS